MIKPIAEKSLLDIPDGTILEMQVKKEHGGKVQVIGVAPNGEFKVIVDYNLNAQPLIDQNMKNEKLNPIPKDWPTNHHLTNKTSPAPTPKTPPKG